MNRLRKKWNSQGGTSILLALLFLLVCTTVAASVLMVAASNAGKIRSGYEEQQKYLALSSALRLAAGQIGEAEYRGAYTVQRWTVPIYDDEGRRIGETKYFHVRQTAGDFTCGELSGVLDLTRELDGLYAKEFSGTGYTALSGAEIAPIPSESKLTVKAEGDDAVEEKFSDIVIKVTLRQDLRIRLTAELKETEDKVYRMEAELAASGLPTLDFTPKADEFPGNASTGAAENLSSTPRAAPSEPDVTWKLDWIAKEVAGEWDES